MASCFVVRKFAGHKMLFIAGACGYRPVRRGCTVKFVGPCGDVSASVTFVSEQQPYEMAGRNISYVKPNEPAFLKRLKEEVGYKEGPTVATKMEQLPSVDDEEEDHDDERPVVVVLKPGDLSQEEADKLFDELEEKTKPVDDKIKFKKPTKRESDSSTENVTTTKRPKSEGKKASNVNTEMKQVRNKCLLSFDDEEHDDD